MLVAAEVNAIIVQGDDFYQTGIDWNQRHIAEKAALCIDWKRARKKALEPLLSGSTASWRPFNFKTGIGLADILNLTILIDTPANIRYMRHNNREGHDDLEWHKLWDDVELYYFEKIRPPSSFDLIISIP